MNIEIQNFKNLKKLQYQIADNKINFLFGLSGSGKSSIVDGLCCDNPIEGKKYGTSNTDLEVITVNGKHFSPTDAHLFDSGKMDFILSSLDVEPVREVIIGDLREHTALHQEMETKLSNLNSSLEAELTKYGEIKQFLSSIKIKKLNKNGTLPNTSTFSKLISNLNSNQNKRLYKEISKIDSKQFQWLIDGIPYISATNKCPFCDKKMSTRKISKLNSYSNFEANTIGELKQAITTNISLLSSTAYYSFSELKKIENQIIIYTKCCMTFEEIQTQVHNLFEEDYDENNFSRILLSKDFKILFPLTSVNYFKFTRSILGVRKSIKRLKEKTNEFLSGKKKVINDYLEKFDIPYTFDVKYHRSGPNEYFIIHKDDINHNDDRESLSFGEKSLISLILFLVASSKTNYQIYFIDDPVSSFDIYRRKLIYNAIFTCLKGKTVIVLSHDPVFAKFALSDNRKCLGDICYLKNNGKNDAIIDKINGTKMESFESSVVERCKTATGEYQKATLARFLLEQKYGTNSKEYTYLSKIIHGHELSEINDWIAKKSTSEINIIGNINKYLELKGVQKNFLSPLTPGYKTFSIMDFSVIEKCMLLRQQINKGLIVGKTSAIKEELNNCIHLTDIYSIGINPFVYPLISRSLFDEINLMPDIACI